MNKLFASVLLCAALLGSGILRADNIVISNRKSSILITAPKGESPRIQYFGPRLANPGDVFDSGSAFNDPVYPQFGVQCSRETAIQATHNDGNMSLELVVESVTRENRDGGQVTAIATRDKFYPFYVTIYYKTYPDCEVIETWTEIRHLEKKPVTLYRFASAFLPVRRGDNWLSHFHGPWGAEAYLYEEALTDGMRVIKDKDGVRNTQNSCPSFMLTLDGRPDEQHGMVIGGHGDTTMIPLVSKATVNGVPVSQFASKKKLDEAVANTMVGGATLTKLIGTSAWYAPGAASAMMVEAILNDQKKMVPCSCYLEGEYGQSDICIGVPAIIGRKGIEKIVKIDLSKEEAEKFAASADAVRKTNNVLHEIKAI